jgi:hypothetical protein
MASKQFDHFFRAFRKDRDAIDELISDLAASTSVSGTQLAAISGLGERWGQLRTMYLIASVDVPSALHNARQIRDVMDDIGEAEMAAVARHIVTIASDAALGSANWTVSGLVASGRSALSASTHAAALALGELETKLMSIYPAVHANKSDDDAVQTYLRKSDHIYNELKAGLHPQRSLSSHLFSESYVPGQTEDNFIALIDNGTSGTFTGNGYADSLGVDFANGVLSVHSYNSNNASGGLGARNNSFTVVQKSGDKLEYYDIHGSALTRRLLELPIAYVPAQHVGSNNVSIRARPDDQPVLTILDGTGAVVGGYLNQTLIGLMRHRSSAGALKATRNVSVRVNDEQILSFPNVLPGDYITFQLTDPGDAAPAAGSYVGECAVFQIAHVTMDIPKASMRIIDIVGQDFLEYQNVDAFLDHGIQEGVELLRELNDYFVMYSNGSILGAMDAYYQKIRLAGDTLSALDDSIFDPSWWLASLNGLQGTTKRKLYTMWYHVIVCDFLNAARVNVEFAKFAMSR